LSSETAPNHLKKRKLNEAKIEFLYQLEVIFQYVLIRMDNIPLDF